VVQGPTRILASEVASQIALHRPYGGVVPEVASRNHLVTLRPVIHEALRRAGTELLRVDVFAATAGPGLASSLLVGNTTAKALSLALAKPFFAINHLEGHLLSPFLGGSDSAGADVPGRVPRSVGLVVSGGHTLLVEVRGFDDYRLLGRTRDDAAGEAFDKGAKLLGLPYPGGPEIERAASGGDPAAFEFPRGLLGQGSLEFSFSGLKTSLLYRLEKLSPEERKSRLPDLCASFQQAIVDVLVAKTIEAARQTSASVVAVSGGVCCNRLLRTELSRAATREGLDLRLAPPRLCTDNAAMIAFVAALKWLHGVSPSPLDSDIDPNLPLEAAP